MEEVLKNLKPFIPTGSKLTFVDIVPIEKRNRSISLECLLIEHEIRDPFNPNDFWPYIIEGMPESHILILKVAPPPFCSQEESHDADNRVIVSTFIINDLILKIPFTQKDKNHTIRQSALLDGCKQTHDCPKIISGINGPDKKDIISEY